jgi:hypothetical protein
MSLQVQFKSLHPYLFDKNQVQDNIGLQVQRTFT